MNIYPSMQLSKKTEPTKSNPNFGNLKKIFTSGTFDPKKANVDLKCLNELKDSAGFKKFIEKYHVVAELRSTLGLLNKNKKDYSALAELNLWYTKIIPEPKTFFRRILNQFKPITYHKMSISVQAPNLDLNEVTNKLRAEIKNFDFVDFVSKKNLKALKSKKTQNPNNISHSEKKISHNEMTNEIATHIETPSIKASVEPKSMTPNVVAWEINEHAKDVAPLNEYGNIKYNFGDVISRNGWIYDELG